MIAAASADGIDTATKIHNKVADATPEVTQKDKEEMDKVKEMIHQIPEAAQVDQDDPSASMSPEKVKIMNKERKDQEDKNMKLEAKVGGLSEESDADDGDDGDDGNEDDGMQSKADITPSSEPKKAKITDSKVANILNKQAQSQQISN